MDGGAESALLGGVIGLVSLIPILVFTHHRVQKNWPWWIVPRLKNKGTVRVGVRNSGGTWNPAKPTPTGRVYASGQATYTLDSDGIVHLRLQPKHGSERSFSGPLPDSYSKPSMRIQKARRTARAVLVAIAVAVAVGFAVGYLASSGPTASRLGWGLFGALVTYIALWALILVIRVVMSVGALRRGKNAP